MLTVCARDASKHYLYVFRLRKIWRNIDKNGDGKVSFDEFVQGLREEPILIKALLQEGPSVEGED